MDLYLLISWKLEFHPLIPTRPFWNLWFLCLVASSVSKATTTQHKQPSSHPSPLLLHILVVVPQPLHHGVEGGNLISHCHFVRSKQRLHADEWQFQELLTPAVQRDDTHYVTHYVRHIH